MSESSDFINDIDFSKVESNPNHIADGKYAAFVYESARVPSKTKPGVINWKAIYKIAPGEQHAGQTVQEYKNVNPTGDKRDQQLSFLKARMEGLGIPESQMSAFLKNPTNIVGNPVWIVVQKRGDNYNITAQGVTQRVEGQDSVAAQLNGQQQSASSAPQGRM